MPSKSIILSLADETAVGVIWAGSAQIEKLSWLWLSKRGNVLAQTAVVSEVAIQADDDKELIWGPAPAKARLIFVVEPKPPGKDYRLARMVTTASTHEQLLYFRHERFSLFGRLNADGTIAKIPPLTPPSVPPKQGTLF